MKIVSHQIFKFKYFSYIDEMTRFTPANWGFTFRNDKSGISCIWVYVLVYKATFCGFKKKQTNFNTTDIYMQINMLHVPPWC